MRHPDVSVPLGTYTGWNERDAAIGGAGLLLRATGSSIPFPPEDNLARYRNRAMSFWSK